MFYNNYLPAQQVIQVNGKASIDAMQMAPNSSVLVMDTTAPIVWMCIADGVGRGVATPYDIAVHHDAPAPNSVEARLDALESNLKRMESMLNVKPDDAAASNEPDEPDKESV